MLRNKEKLAKEAKRRKKEAARLGKKSWKQRMHEKWEGLKSTFYGIKRDPRRQTMDKYVSEPDNDESAKKAAAADEELPHDDWADQMNAEDTEDTTEDSTR